MDNNTDIQGESHKDWTLDALSNSIRQLHESLAARAKHAVNVALTLRNWLIGFYIAEYQMNGADRAKYGEQLIPLLAKRLVDLPNCHKRQLYDYLLFYRTWPTIVPTVSALLNDGGHSNSHEQKMPTLSALLSEAKLPSKQDMEEFIRHNRAELEKDNCQ